MLPKTLSDKCPKLYPKLQGRGALKDIINTIFILLLFLFGLSLQNSTHRDEKKKEIYD